jgi:hypothetical protein
MKNKSNDGLKLNKLLEDIENIGYTFKGEDKELVDTAKSKLFPKLRPEI